MLSLGQYDHPTFTSSPSSSSSSPPSKQSASLPPRRPSLTRSSSLRTSHKTNLHPWRHLFLTLSILYRPLQWSRPVASFSSEPSYEGQRMFFEHLGPRVAVDSFGITSKIKFRNTLAATACTLFAGWRSLIAASLTTAPADSRASTRQRVHSYKLKFSLIHFVSRRIFTSTVHVFPTLRSRSANTAFVPAQLAYVSVKVMLCTSLHLVTSLYHQPPLHSLCVHPLHLH